MFIIDLHYTHPLETINQHLVAHREFLKQHYESGLFILSGAKNPRTGGIIIANTQNRQLIEKIISEDPFYQQKIALYTITEFIPTMSHDLLQSLITPTPQKS